MSAVAPISTVTPLSAPDEIRVMVVDDAIVVRTLVSRWIGEQPDLKVVGALRTGREAIDHLDRLRPDVVVLDIEMPDLDGLSTLPRLLEKRRDLVVIMASALTRLHAEISLKALALGAADYIPKPEGEGSLITSAAFQHDLIEKIRALGARRHRLARRLAEAKRDELPTTRRTAGAIRRVGRWSPPEGEPAIRLRPFPHVVPRVLLIGASTGGPQALTKLVAHLDVVVDAAPILITQHMPATFTTIMAEHLARASAKPVREAINGEPVVAGTIYIAPGGKHMRVMRRNGTAVVVLDDGPPINFCKPAVDPLFASAAEVWGNWNLGLILTGMGTDGTRGAADIVTSGGSIIAQDEATSVIWGMPGSVAEAGLCSAVLPLDQIAPTVARMFLGARP